MHTLLEGDCLELMPSIPDKSVKRHLSNDHKRKISEATKGRKVWSEGKKMTKTHVLKNMVNHLQYDVTINDLIDYEDIEKLKILNGMLKRDRVSKHFNTEKYLLFIDKFYNDVKFNNIYQNWIINPNKWSKPSLDHIQPTSKEGSWELNNLQILTWFENRAKCDMTQNEWETFKEETNTNSAYFI